MTSTDQQLANREVASGASNTADGFTDREDAGTRKSADILYDDTENGGRGISQKADNTEREGYMNQIGSSGNDPDRLTVGNIGTPTGSSALRQSPDGRAGTTTPLPDISTKKEVPLESSDEDDGGWRGKGGRRSGAEQSLTSSRPQRAILQGTPRTNSRNIKTLPEPMSNNLVLRNGRIPAARQQSTLFKEIRTPRGSSTRGSRRLPAISRKGKPGSSKPLVQTTFKAEELVKKPGANIKKPKQKLSKSETNYIRLAKMIVKVGSDLLRLAFYNHLEKQQPPKKLHQFLAANRRRLKSFASSYKLITRRWDIMYPDDDETKANLEELDSALVFWFLRFICVLKRPNDFIWKRKPLSTDLSETADIARLRDYRNFLINLSSPALYDDEYDRKVRELKEVTLRICGERQGEEMVAIIDDMKVGVVRYSEREQYLDMLTQWAEETGDRQIAPAKQSGESLKQRKEMTRRFLQTHRIPSIFVRTKIYLKAQEKLMKNGFVILKGNIGDGKTTTAIGLMVSNFDEDDCLLITNPDQWQYVEPRTVSALLLDDIFGSGALDEKLLSEWESMFDQIYENCMDTNERTGVRVIITIRHNILDQCYSKLSKYKLFAKDKIVDCSSVELLMTEKRNICGKHLMAEDKVQMVSKSEIDKGAKNHDSKLGYPQCCALFVKKDTFLIIGSQFFERPIELLFDQLDKLYDGDKYGYLALVVLLFQKDGILFQSQLQNFTDGPFKTKVLDLAFLIRVPISDHLNKFTLNALENQVRPYINFYNDRKCYTFSHESIMEAVMASFGERHPQEVLEGCTLPFLMDFVATDENVEERPDEIFMMRVKKENFLVLAKVLEHYITSGEVKKISQHRVMKDLRFIQFFFNYIQQKDDCEKLILSEDRTMLEGKGSRRHVGLLFGAIDQEVPNVELVTTILATDVHAQKPIKKKWCEDELKAAICMAVKRGSFDIYKQLIKTGIEPPDELMEEEEYITSVDVMRDLLNRRQWSNEQKDMALVRASRGIRTETQEIVTLLLQDNVAVNSIRAGTTPLCEAVKSGKLKTVMLLLTSGASVNDRDATQQTPLHHACDWNNIEVVKILLKRQADVNAKDTLGFTPLLIAAGWGRETIIDLLLAKKVDPLAMDDQENNVLHICAANGKANIISKLLTAFPKEMHSILIARNRHGWTPLDFALRCGHLNATKLLIQTVLQVKPTILKTQQRTFVHTRFFVVKLDDFNVDEKYQYRFLEEGTGKTCFQMPRCNWFIQAGNRDEYEEVRLFSIKYENKLRQYLAKN